MATRPPDPGADIHPHQYFIKSLINHRSPKIFNLIYWGGRVQKRWALLRKKQRNNKECVWVRAFPLVSISPFPRRRRERLKLLERQILSSATVSPPLDPPPTPPLALNPPPAFSPLFFPFLSVSSARNNSAPPEPARHHLPPYDAPARAHTGRHDGCSLKKSSGLLMSNRWGKVCRGKKKI